MSQQPRQHPHVINWIRHGMSHNNIHYLLGQLQQLPPTPEHHHWITFLQHYIQQHHISPPLQDPPLLHISIRQCISYSPLYIKLFKHIPIIFTTRLRRTIETAIYLFQYTHKIICPIPDYEETGPDPYAENIPDYNNLDHLHNLCTKKGLIFCDYYYKETLSHAYPTPSAGDITTLLNVHIPTIRGIYKDSKLSEYNGHRWVFINHFLKMKELMNTKESPMNLDIWAALYTYKKGRKAFGLKRWSKVSNTSSRKGRIILRGSL